MSKWTSCKDKLPPRWKKVKVNSGVEKFTAYRSLFGSWICESGVTHSFIGCHDYWMPLTESADE